MQMSPTPVLVNLSDLRDAFYRGETYLTRPDDDCHLQVTEENIKKHLEEYLVKHALKSDPTKTDYYGARDIIIDMMEFMHNERKGCLIHFFEPANLFDFMDLGDPIQGIIKWSRYLREITALRNMDPQIIFESHLFAILCMTHAA